MARVQMKMVGAIFIVAAMLTTTAVIPRADAQSTSTGQTKRDKQKVIVDDEPESVFEAKQGQSRLRKRPHEVGRYSQEML